MKRERHWIVRVLTSLKHGFIDEVIAKWVIGKHRHALKKIHSRHDTSLYSLPCAFHSLPTTNIKAPPLRPVSFRIHASTRTSAKGQAFPGFLLAEQRIFSLSPLSHANARQGQDRAKEIGAPSTGAFFS